MADYRYISSLNAHHHNKRRNNTRRSLFAQTQDCTFVTQKWSPGPDVALAEQGPDREMTKPNK